MDLKSEHPFWLIKNPLLKTYPALNRSLKTDVLIMGAGITGALIAEVMTDKGLNVVVLDKREVGWGSSAASTALIQYEIDTSLSDLSKIAGEANASRIYKLCLEAVKDLGRTATKHNLGEHYSERKSFYFASNKDDLKDLEQEFKIRTKHDLPVTWWTESQINEKFSFKAPGGIMSDAGAQVDVYRLLHALLASVADKGGQIYDRTAITSIDQNQNGIQAFTADGHKIEAKKLVIAAGYESQNYLPKPVARLHSTFAFVTEPLDSFPGWHEQALLWETARPYLYGRTTADGRALFGGEDVVIRNGTIRDLMLGYKIKKLQKRLQKMFPNIPMKAAFSWAGTFAETPDGLPFIGAHPDLQHTLFAMCYGGNGIVYSVLAARMLTDAALGIEHPDLKLFGFNRSWV